MRVKMGTGCRMPEIPMKECGVEFFQRERVLLILAGGIRDTGKGTAGCGIKSIKSQVTDVTRKIETATLPGRDGDKHSELE